MYYKMAPPRNITRITRELIPCAYKPPWAVLPGQGVDSGVGAPWWSKRAGGFFYIELRMRSQSPRRPSHQISWPTKIVKVLLGNDN